MDEYEYEKQIKVGKALHKAGGVIANLEVENKSLKADRNRLVEALEKIAGLSNFGDAGFAEEIARDALAAVKEGPVHASDCAIYNAPALKPGPCNCGFDDRK